MTARFRFPAARFAAALAAGALAATAAHAQSGDPALQAAIDGDWRPDGQTARDPWRNPAETLAFFDIDPSGRIAEVAPGGGYYMNIVAPWAAMHGGEYVAVLGALDAAENPQQRAMADGLEAAVAEAGAELDVQYGELSADSARVAPPESLDAVLTFRNTHGWVFGGYAQKAFEDFYAALKPGGVLGLVQHRLPEDSELGNTAETGYMRRSWVVEMAQNAGFVLEAESEINANPADSADHALGVWTLPPTRRTPEPGSAEAEGFDRAALDAIGESDRMTLRFRKPE